MELLIKLNFSTVTAGIATIGTLTAGIWFLYQSHDVYATKKHTLILLAEIRLEALKEHEFYYRNKPVLTPQEATRFAEIKRALVRIEKKRFDLLTNK